MTKAERALMGFLVVIVTAFIAEHIVLILDVDRRSPILLPPCVAPVKK